MTNQEQREEAEQVGSLRADYERMRRQFDELERDSYSGHQMETLMRSFLAKWERPMQQLAQWPAEVRQQLARQTGARRNFCDSLEADLELLKLAPKYERLANDKEANYWNDYKQARLVGGASELHRLISDIYRRTSEAIYLRVTYNKARKKQEDDRREPFRFSQQAIRYDPHAIKTCLWYTVTLGWCIEGANSPRERTLAGETFKRAVLRCISMEPGEALLHHLLGIYYFHVAHLNWFQRSVAKSLLGVKVEGSYTDAEREFRLSFERRNDWMPTGLWMAKVLLAQNKPLDQAREWVKFGLALEALEPSSELDRAELLELARRLKVSPRDES